MALCAICVRLADLQHNKSVAALHGRAYPKSFHQHEELVLLKLPNFGTGKRLQDKLDACARQCLTNTAEQSGPLIAAAVFSP